MGTYYLPCPLAYSPFQAQRGVGRMGTTTNQFFDNETKEIPQGTQIPRKTNIGT